MTKKVIALTIKDLKDLGIINNKRKRKKRKHRQKRKMQYMLNNLDGIKSSSDHMQGFGLYSAPPFNNTSNLQTEYLQLKNNELQRSQSMPYYDPFELRNFAKVMNDRHIDYQSQFRDQSESQNNIIRSANRAFTLLTDALNNDSEFASTTFGSDQFKSQGDDKTLGVGTTSRIEELAPSPPPSAKKFTSPRKTKSSTSAMKEDDSTASVSASATPVPQSSSKPRLKIVVPLVSTSLSSEHYTREDIVGLKGMKAKPELLKAYNIIVPKDMQLKSISDAGVADIRREILSYIKN
jgi:hypothetical protein